MKKSKKCYLCKDDLKLATNFRSIPLSNNFNIQKDIYENNIFFCFRCDFGIHSNFIADKILYNKNYLYRGNLNLQKLNFLKKILKKYKDKSILEIGGGDGYLGKSLTQYFSNIKYLNFDPSSTRGFRTKVKRFEKVKLSEKFDLVICINLLAHISDPKKILKNIKKHSHSNTKYIFLVQNSVKEFSKGYYDNVYHEHKFYFSPFSFRKFFKKENFKLFFFDSNLHGSSIVATNDKDIKLKLSSSKKIFTKKKKIILSLQNYENRINKLKIKISNTKKNLIGIGCAPRSIKLLFDLREVLNKIIKIYEPKNSKKIGLKIPGTKIKIFKENILNKNSTYLWLPYHIKVPQKFKNVIIPFKK